ncbi:redoxin domain-containing protein [Aureliella helgolandensis]|uniref:Thiol-disulfide oxidoreductase ResA n=1 Tax=Aureliella helgolandensis TaxID=2527968 RepID=A0A518GEU2_9BACT|nr:redoxin domain-containing protein [Aureliella helgolandensis]QDV27077.1 Thiol-disulfide oxidoreductase ResA [Aureliella helgolandensis]
MHWQLKMDSVCGQGWLRKSLAGALACCAACASLHAAEPSDQLVKALSYAPAQPDVNYEKVSKEQLGECTIEELKRDDGKGFWITGPAGQPLRWFADTDGDNKIDRWSYYNAGVEVYREVDTDANRTADAYRWLSTEGMRWGVDKNEDGVVEEWSVISAEEVTAEVVRAVAAGDPARFARLLIADAEIASLGLGAEKEAALRKRVTEAGLEFTAWASGQKVVTPRSRWTNFGADKPGIVPAGTDGSTKDLVVYENTVALMDEGGEARQLLVGTMIQVGSAWRLVDLPEAVSDGSIVSGEGMFFSATFSPRGGRNAPEVTGGISKAMERLVPELQEIDEKLVSGSGNMEVLQAGRADVLEKLVSAATDGKERADWIRQFADTVSAAAQAGEYTGGVARLREFAAKLSADKASEEELAYVVYRTIAAAHNLEMQQPEADYEKLQGNYLDNLKAFVTKYPQSPDAADAMLQMALSAEFSGESKTAQEWYGKASKGFGSTLPGRKAAGALRRLELVGNRFGLEGKTLDQRNFSSSSYLGGPVVYHCWASWCEGCKAEMRALKELQAKYAKTKLKIVGINFDNSEADFARRTTFLQEGKFPWVHLVDEGGLDSDLAVGYGILTLPLNIVVDSSGKVVKTGVHWTELDGVIEGLVK